ncbi:MAG: TssA family type VI secretion system protein [Deltaproteobacteria bacterium]|jgi:type VI secretion system protein VasJ|nr:TssA family type VI secretion system protein [Deltaproteobacteria bacterium]
MMGPSNVVLAGQEPLTADFSGLLPYEELGRFPIAGPKPGGRSVKDEEAFDVIRREVASLTALSGQNRATDWNIVIDSAAKLLSEVGKDFLVATWLGVGLVNCSGVRGLGQAAMILSDIIEYFWLECEPPVAKCRLRLVALDWFEEQAARLLTPRDRAGQDEIKQARVALAKLSQNLGQRLPNELRGFGTLKEILDRIKVDPMLSVVTSQIMPSPEEAAGQAVATSQGKPDQEATRLVGSQEEAASGESTSRQTPVAARSPQSLVMESIEAPEGHNLTLSAGIRVETGNAAGEEDLSRPLSFDIVFKGDSNDRRSIRRELLSWAGEILTADLSDPASYVLRRFALWSLMAKSLEIKKRRTVIPAPPGEILRHLRRLLDTGQVEKAVQEAESAADRQAYWLDLSEVSASSLKKLGLSRAARALEGAVAGLIWSVPNLVESEFDDGTPLADGRTREWLAGLTRPTGGGASISGPPVAGVVDEVEPTLEVLSRRLEAGLNGRDKLKVLTLIFPILAIEDQANQIEILAQSVWNLIRRHKLEEYDPSLAAEALEAALLAGLAVRPKRSVNEEKQPEALSEILANTAKLLAKLSPQRLLRVSQRQ